MLDARLLRGPQHFPGIRERRRHGLFADNVLACLRSRHRHGVMHINGCTQVNNLHIFAPHHLAPVGFHFLPAELSGSRFRRSAVTSADHLHSRFEFTLEKAADLPVGVGVRLPHKLVADQSEIHLRHPGTLLLAESSCELVRGSRFGAIREFQNPAGRAAARYFRPTTFP